MSVVHVFIWVAIALCCAVVELAGRATGRWFSLGCGAFIAAISCFFIELPELQALVFVLGAGGCFIGMRVLAWRAGRKRLLSVVGMHAQVTQAMAPGIQGVVTVDGCAWPARCDTVVLAGTTVEVLSDNQNVLLVRPVFEQGSY